MAQNSPGWVTVLISVGGLLIGGGGLFGAIYGGIKLVSKNIEQHQRIQDLEKFLAEAKKKQERLIDEFAEQLGKIDSGQLGTEESFRLRQLMNLTEGLFSLSEGFSHCNRAANWLRIHKTDWTRQASEESINRYRKLIPRDKMKPFREDVGRYLEWAIACLDQGGKTNIALSDFVAIPSIASDYPYVAAISYLEEGNHYQDLEIEEKKYLKLTLNRLIEKIRENVKD